MKKTLSILGIAAFAGIANATVWEFTYPSQGLTSNSDGGEIKNVRATYDDATQQLGYYVTFGQVPNSTLKTNGYWLVMSPGPNPKGHADELSIFYFDRSGAGSPKLTVNNYNGQNADNSWNGGNQIFSSLRASDQSKITSLYAFDRPNGDQEYGFKIDARSINGYKNSADWTGAKFGQNIGVWFHPVAGLTTSYNNNFLCGWNYRSQGWLDTTNSRTVATPEPATFAAMGVGALALLKRRKSK